MQFIFLQDNFLKFIIHKFVLSLFIFGPIFSALENKSFALPQYRCSGQVQYRPCNDDRSIPALKSMKNRPAKFDISARAQMKRNFVPPTVFLTKYKYSQENAIGIWSGFVQGEGPIVLRLRLNIPGLPPENRYMGKAILRGKVSPFEFRSTPPKGSRWNWYIQANNEAG